MLLFVLFAPARSLYRCPIGLLSLLGCFASRKSILIYFVLMLDTLPAIAYYRHNKAKH